jgi:hypothetical protein
LAPPSLVVPVGQALHDVAPLLPLNVPAGHAEQAACLVLGLYVPALQKRHDEAPLPLNVPAEQEEQEVAPLWLNVPAPQV